MTTDLEKQFFSVFEIPKIFKTTINTGDLDLNYVEIQAPTLKELYEEAQYDFNTPIYFSWFKRSKRWSEEYPEITDRHYLELICILNRHFNATGGYPIMLLGLGYEPLKEHILKRCIHNEDNIKHQVQELFKGVR